MWAGQDGPRAGTAIGWYDASMIEAWRTAARRARQRMAGPDDPASAVRASLMASSEGWARPAGPGGRVSAVIEAPAADLLAGAARVSWRERPRTRPTRV